MKAIARSSIFSAERFVMKWKWCALPKLNLQRMLILFVSFLFLSLSSQITYAFQQGPIPENSALDVTAHTIATMYEGPGSSYFQVSQLQPGQLAQIAERNYIGNWVRVLRLSADRYVLNSGWVMLGYLRVSPELRLSDVPINTELGDGVPGNVAGMAVGALYNTPVISTVSPAMIEVYQRGLALGNLPNVVTKVGDSLSADETFLRPMSLQPIQLGPYNFLSYTVAFYGASTAGASQAARVGMNTFSIVDPQWADGTVCASGETPIQCEYRLRRPSIAFILFGPNDVIRVDADQYETQMRLIVEETLNHGIIPVLSTFSYNPNAEFFTRAVEYNHRIIEIATEYQLPLINLFVASRPLSNYGLDQDGIHMLRSGMTTLDFASGLEAFYGASLRNLLTIRMLDEIRRTIEPSMEDIPTEATPEITPEATMPIEPTATLVG